MLFSLTRLSVKVKILVAAAIIIVLAAYIVFNLTGNRSEFRTGVNIEGIDVSGLSMPEAKALLNNEINKKYGSSSISLLDGEKKHGFALKDISYRFLIDEALAEAFQKGRSGNLLIRAFDSLVLVFKGSNTEIVNDFDRSKLTDILKKIKAETDKEPESAYISYKNGKLEISKDILGRSMDIDINKKLVENQLEKRNFDDIALKVDNINADITYAQIKDVNTVISDFHTNFSLNDTNRSDNIRLACSKLDGIILKPGQEFSMNEALGPRTTKNGYKEAPVIFKNELVPGTGGGVCQVTTTLYNSVLLAKLEVLKRSPHSMPLGYVQPSQDATIAEGSIDFKFRNSRDYPVYISAVVKGNTIRIQLLGRKPADKTTVKLRSEILETIPPEEEEIEIDDSLPDGEKVEVKKARDGIRSILYRETYSENNVLLNSEVISKDYYKPARGLVKINSNYMIFLTVEGYLNE